MSDVGICVMEVKIMAEFFSVLYQLFVDMGYYMMLGLSLVAIFNLFMNKDVIVRYLGDNGFLASVRACLLGVPLPLCSCGVVPTSIYLKDKGASSSTVSAFLISTPQTGVDSIVATYGLMGITFAWFRPVAAFLSGVIGGSAVSIFAKDKDNKVVGAKQTPTKDESITVETEKKRITLNDITGTLKYSFVEMVSGIAIYFIVGLIISAAISVLLPADLLAQWGIGSGILTMLLMILIGLPMYICSSASIPIALTLMAKGISPGAAFVFLFMGPFTNAASLSILIKKLGKKVIFVYVTAATICAIGFGLLLDWLVTTFGLPIINTIAMEDSHMHISVFQQIVAYIFFGLIVYSLFRKIKAFYNERKIRELSSDKARVYAVDGMTCGNCALHVQEELLKLENVTNAKVDHEEKTATVWGDVDADAVKKAIEQSGYSVRKDG